ncbi:glutamate 5-kinase [Spiribacter halobius]|uniref:Glutamate 5-kinase n=1 Tax=Sediminicurvatus halobius TaxID=2182432 RepID=A0A2U2N7V0_9GAMM|nr:glutamate 5-kinase [Spiribacter halobius]PWG65153.1 glutamate 5-kinase [Spiribacter halobius]UEX78897.1 glutamate 5-kinase [Spiribacter halobius]
MAVTEGGRRRWVVKVGSALVTAGGRGLDHERIGSWVEQVVAARRRGTDVVLVSSGSVAEGVKRLGWRRRPSELHQLQAAAAVGQMGLVQAYESAFQRFGLHTAQILLTHEDLADRRRYLNARGTLRALLEMGVVPVVNENDTIATDEIRFGDNDTLAALVSNLVEADLLLILTDQEGLYDADPRQHPDARLIQEARADDPRLLAMCSEAPGVLGSGGMRAKVQAAVRAARSGATTVIASGRGDDTLARVGAGEAVGTRLTPARERIAARKQWLAGQLQVRGRLRVDAGAARVLREAGRSLLPVGVTAVEGRFRRGEMVSCVDPEGREVARGLVNYDADEAARLCGVPSQRIEAVLGYVSEPELVHRDNLVVLE